jgi:cytochrome b6-f complex iron-sulfur subunit
MNRRELIQRVLLGGAVLVMVPAVVQSCSKDSTTDPGTNPTGKTIEIDLSLPANAALNTPGGSKVTQDVLVFNANGSFLAVSAVCTHQGCTVTYDLPANNIKCPCHGSMFANSGSVINGPATSALQSYPVSKSGNMLTITL